MLNYHINQPSETAQAEASRRWDGVAKPLHSLGVLEDIITQIAGIQGNADVRLTPRCALVFCADHGVVRQGVSQSGQEVTGLVAASIADGTANVNLMAASARCDVFCVDVGMAADVDDSRIIIRKTRRGTGDMTTGPAMTMQDTEAAVQAGIDLVGDMKKRGYQIIATGEMGIGNTTAAAALCSALTGFSPEITVGRGAGLSDEGLARKRWAVAQAMAVNQPNPMNPMDTLAKLGGLEIAAMAGAFLGGMTSGVPVIIDGVISATAALAACRICPQAREYMIPSHMSREAAAVRVMQALQLRPVIQADMALGEGTGAVALMPLLDMAHNVYAGTHTFTDLGMAAYTPQGGAS